MRAAVLRAGSVETRPSTTRRLDRDSCFVRSLACGICASDLHFMDHSEAGADDDSGMST
jgi:threonine dehydrogenase-like Zn-dependent dehydrogenase